MRVRLQTIAHLGFSAFGRAPAPAYLAHGAVRPFRSTAASATKRWPGLVPYLHQTTAVSHAGPLCIERRCSCSEVGRPSRRSLGWYQSQRPRRRVARSLRLGVTVKANAMDFVNTRPRESWEGGDVRAQGFARPDFVVLAFGIKNGIALSARRKLQLFYLISQAA